MSKKYCPYCYREVEEADVAGSVGWVCEYCGTIFKEDEVTDRPNGKVEEPLGSDNIPEGCRACGGPYPYCKTSCSIFDD